MNEQFPSWLPKSAKNYLQHVEGGQSIRSLARLQGCHASTVLRQVRKFEKRRDDFLIDEALMSLEASVRQSPKKNSNVVAMNAHTPSDLNPNPPDDLTIEREGRRILRRLSESGAVLAVSREMEKAVVVREFADGRTLKTGVVDRTVAQAMALKDWISCKSEGRISRYRITQRGRSALKRLLANDPKAHHGFAEAAAPFGDQHREWGERSVMEEAGKKPHRVRYNVAESPLSALARRKNQSGEPFLGDDLVASGERLREDFEMAQMGPRVAQNWEKFLTGGDRGSYSTHDAIASGPEGARQRVQNALSDLGPGLADVALRCCCFLEGLESAEKRMGWSARSGKIVLRIALQRLKRHYEASGNSTLIG